MTEVECIDVTPTVTTSEKAVNVAKLVGEVVVTPGASLLVDGKIAAGGLHVVLGVAARVFLGVPGILLVAANSYSKSVTKKSLLQHITGNATNDQKPSASSPN